MFVRKWKTWTISGYKSKALLHKNETTRNFKRFWIAHVVNDKKYIDKDSPIRQMTPNWNLLYKQFDRYVKCIIHLAVLNIYLYKQLPDVFWSIRTYNDIDCSKTLAQILKVYMKAFSTLFIDKQYQSICKLDFKKQLCNKKDKVCIQIAVIKKFASVTM